MSGANSTQRPDTVRETLQDFWNNRPVRPRVGGKLGGVSAAIGLRYGIDPVLVRVAFLIAAFYGGSGIALYLLGWMLLPKEDVSGLKSTSTKMIVLLALLLFPVSFWVLDVPGLFGMTLGFGALYLLHTKYRDRAPQNGVARFVASSPPAPPEPPTPMGQEPVSQTPTAQPSASAATVETETSATHPGGEAPTEPVAPQQETPPSWNPPGPAPFASDLPEPTRPVPPRPKRRWISLGTIGLAIVAAVLTYAGTESATYSSAVALGVLGVGMLVGAFLQGGRGLIAVAVPVAALTIVLAALSLTGPWRGFSAEAVTATTLESVQPNYAASVGDIRLNLSRLGITDGQEVRTSANVNLGNITVRVPDETDVTAKCAVDAGRVQCLAGAHDGERQKTATTDYGPDGPGGGHIVLDLWADAGNVEVLRG